jgi:hypothetical protein
MYQTSLSTFFFRHIHYYFCNSKCYHGNNDFHYRETNVRGHGCSGPCREINGWDWSNIRQLLSERGELCICYVFVSLFASYSKVTCFFYVHIISILNLHLMHHPDWLQS